MLNVSWPLSLTGFQGQSSPQPKDPHRAVFPFGTELISAHKSPLSSLRHSGQVGLGVHVSGRGAGRGGLARAGRRARARCLETTQHLALVTNNPPKITEWFLGIKVIVCHKPLVCFLESLIYCRKFHP